MSAFHLMPLPFLGRGTHLDYVEDAAGVVCDPHHHLYHELDYVLKGQGTFAVGSQKISVKTGDVIYLARGVHHWRMSVMDDPLVLCNLTICDQDMHRLLNSLPAGHAEWLWWRHWPESVLVTDGVRDVLRSLVGLMRKRLHVVRIKPRQSETPPMRRRVSDGRLSSKELNRLLPGITELLLINRGDTPDPGLGALADRVRREPHLSLSLDEEAGRLGVSRWWLSRVFKRRFGVTLWEHRDYARVDLAIQRLLSSDIPVRELGRSLGFRGTAQFIATFKRLTGLTPGRLRRRYGSATADAAVGATAS